MGILKATVSPIAQLAEAVDNQDCGRDFKFVNNRDGNFGFSLRVFFLTEYHSASTHDQLPLHVLIVLKRNMLCTVYIIPCLNSCKDGLSRGWLAPNLLIGSMSV